MPQSRTDGYSLAKEFCDASFSSDDCCYLRGLFPFGPGTLLLCTDRAFMTKSGKIPMLSLAPDALPFLLSADETKKKDIKNKGTVAAGAASNLNEVSPSKEHPSLSSEEQRAPFRSALAGTHKESCL